MEHTVAKSNNRKIWGFVVVWLIMFLVVKSIEQVLYITAIGALVFWGSSALKRGRGRDTNNSKKNHSLKETDAKR